MACMLPGSEHSSPAVRGPICPQGPTDRLECIHRTTEAPCTAAGPAVEEVHPVGKVLGDLLPLAVGVAISPVPIIAVILMLLAPKAGRASTGFLIMWVVGIAAATTVFLL